MSDNDDIFPLPATMMHAAKLSITQDKPIYLNYYLDTECEKAWLAEDKDTNERILMKSNTDNIEYTDNIKKLYKVGSDFIIITNDSIYIVHSNIKKRHFKISSLYDCDNGDKLQDPS